MHRGGAGGSFIGQYDNLQVGFRPLIFSRKTHLKVKTKLLAVSKETSETD